MHILSKPQRITRTAQRVSHSVRRKLAEPLRTRSLHSPLHFSDHRTAGYPTRHDFEIALLVRERDAPAHRILVLEVSPRQPLADHRNRLGALLVAVVNLTPGQDL